MTRMFADSSLAPRIGIARAGFVLVALVFVSVGSAGAAEAPPQPQEQTRGAGILSPCRPEGFAEDLLCGRLEVFEDRAAASGRKIALEILVLPARGPHRLDDPIVYIAGGPGDSSIHGARWLPQSLSGAREQRDFLFVDLRGTGGSNPLLCEEMMGRQGLQGFLDEFLPIAAVRACRERLAQGARLEHYATDSAVDDLEEVRRALGYGKLNLLGASYGTRAALVFLRRHPESVRTVTLLGAVPLGDRLPLSFARDFDEALFATFAECAAERACAAAFPDLRADLEAALTRLNAAPALLRLTDPETGGKTELRLSRAGFLQILRYMLYVPTTATLVPLAVHLAGHGEFQALAEPAQIVAAIGTSLADGVYLSVTCAEDLPFISAEEADAATRGTLLGEFRIAKQKAACAGWPVPPVARDFLAPVASAVPALVISGERDPVTPARFGEEAVRHLAAGRHLVIPDAGHDVEGLKGVDCHDRLLESFIAAGSATGLDTACLTGIERSPFLLSRGPNRPLELSETQLARVAGRYAEAEGPALEVQLAEGRLRLVMPGRPAILLRPVEPLRFALEGLPPTYAVIFEEREGKITALLFEQGASEPERLERQP